MTSTLLLRRLRGPALFVLILLALELLDEFVFGAQEAAWPLIRSDLNLSYFQIGLLLSVPALLATFLEPMIGILADVGHRRVLMLGGGIGFALACLLMAASQNFAVLMLALIVFFPSSGALVGLAQAALMDHDPSRHEQNMARWSFAGSAGVVCGSLTLGAAAAIGLGWRAPLLAAAVTTLLLWVVLARYPIRETTAPDEEQRPDFVEGVRNAFRALRRREVIRWLTLLEFANLMLDVLYGFIALYFVDVVGVNAEQATLAVVTWTSVGLLGDFLLIPLLERVRGLNYLRVSAVLEFILFPALLLVPGFVPKLVILGLLGFFNAGWYAILSGQLYSAMPGQSGTVMTLSNISGLLGRVLPLAIGVAAERFGLGAAIWLCLLGPIALLIGLPRNYDAIAPVDALDSK